MVVDIFGQPADMDALMFIAEKYNLKVVADNFQFVMWTIIAIIAVTIAMKMTRKAK